MKNEHNIEVGDLVKCAQPISVSSGGPRKGECFLVTKVGSHSIGFSLKRLSNYYDEAVKNGTRTNWGSSCFKIVAKNSNSKAVKILFGEK